MAAVLDLVVEAIALVADEDARALAGPVRVECEIADVARARDVVADRFGVHVPDYYRSSALGKGARDRSQGAPAMPIIPSSERSCGSVIATSSTTIGPSTRVSKRSTIGPIGPLTLSSSAATR